MKHTNRISSFCKAVTCFLLAASAFANVGWASDADQHPSPERIAGCNAQSNADAHRELQKTREPSTVQALTEALSSLKSKLDALDATCDARSAVFTRMAAYQFQLEDFNGAADSSFAALSVPDVERKLAVEDIGLNHFILGTIYNARGRYSDALREHVKAAQSFAQSGKQNAGRAARIYSDAALLEIKMGDLRSAERYLTKSSAIAESSNTISETDKFLVLDAVAHFQYERGRLTEADHTLSEMVRSYGSSTAVRPSLRAHLYRDCGELSVATGNLDQASDQLQKSTALARVEPVPGNVALSLAMLGNVYVQQGQLHSAEQLFREACDRVGPHADEVPGKAAIVYAVYGSYLHLCRRWRESRTHLQRALQLADEGAGNEPLRANCLSELADAAHHLHIKDEEKSMRSQAKALAAGFRPATDGALTVDLLALKGGLH
jgi:tetratricopeptide (TPR) repeat protein